MLNLDSWEVDMTMRYCSQEQTNFPSSQFSQDASGRWMHKPPGVAEGHPAGERAQFPNEGGGGGGGGGMGINRPVPLDKERGWY